MVNIPLPKHRFSGNATEHRDAGGSLGKSFLFFLTIYYPGISLAGDRVKWLEEHTTFGVSNALSTVHENLWECTIWCLVVPITASGPQGEQPLVK